MRGGRGWQGEGSVIIWARVWVCVIKFPMYVYLCVFMLVCACFL